ncbi:MAG: hypothetical protein ACQEQC_06930 [Elusimicrobiota bacterium]
MLFNTSGESVKIKHGRRIAQIVLQKIEKIEWSPVQELSSSSRDTGGFGSTGS